jgi:hypothetical protein
VDPLVLILFLELQRLRAAEAAEDGLMLLAAIMEDLAAVLLWVGVI